MKNFNQYIHYKTPDWLNKAEQFQQFKQLVLQTANELSILHIELCVLILSHQIMNTLNNTRHNKSLVHTLNNKTTTYNNPYLNQNTELVLTLKTISPIAMRLRHRTPQLLAALKYKGVIVEKIVIEVISQSHPDFNHIMTQYNTPYTAFKDSNWVNPNEEQYGQRTKPTPQQRAYLFKLLNNNNQ